ncbi:MAG: hypothetical protein ACD_60C00090G0013 [uncultured bacterium]|nr:MAG: hypothetical protein ACD_60C00090G0013 [uncultured bacterium]
MTFFKLQKNEVEQLLMLILDSSSAFNGLSKENKASLVEETADHLSNIEITRENIKQPDMQTKLGMALAAVFVSRHPGGKALSIDFEKLFQGYGKNESRLSIDEKKQLISKLLTALYECDPKEAALFLNFMNKIFASYKKSMPSPEAANEQTYIAVPGSTQKLMDTYGIVTKDKNQALLTFEELAAISSSTIDYLEIQGELPLDGGSFGAEITRKIMNSGLTTTGAGMRPDFKPH